MALALFVHQIPEGPPAVEILVYPGWFLVLQLLVPALALILGSAVFAEELEDRTLTYLFTRPVPRAAVLLGRWLAAALVLTLLLAASLGLFVLAATRGGGPAEPVGPGVAGPLAAMAVAGGLVYLAIFAVLGTFMKRPMIAGLAYVFAVEGFLGNLPGRTQSLTVQYYLRSYIADRGAEAWRKIDPIDAFTSLEGPEAVRTLVLVLLVALALGSWIVSRRQYVLPA
jgi:hypothetical protein